MTEPTDAEIEQLYLEETGFDLNDSPAALLDFAHAVLAKWGQPAQKTVTVVPAQAAESRTIPDREIPGIVERALQELEGLVKYATSTYGHWDMRRAKGALSDLEWWARRKLAAHAQAAEPVAWYEGHPPFPQDQEWFIAETIYGDKVVLRSLDEGREHKGNYAFKTADQTYMKAEIIKRWMQFPDCEYLPPTAPQPVAREPLSDEQIEALPMWKRFVGLWPETRREIVRIIEAQHGIKGVQHVGNVD